MNIYTDNGVKQVHAQLSSSDNAICPQKLYIGITEDCNIYCQMCRDSVSIKGNNMPMELFMGLVDETAPFVRSYSLFNWGEPLLVKDFKDRVRYLNSKKREDAVVDISTNGVLLNKEMVDFLYDQKVSITISFDGKDKATFEKIRCGANFDTVCKNVLYAADKYSSLYLTMQPQLYTTLQKDNTGQLLDVVKLAYSLGIRRYGFGVLCRPEQFAIDDIESACMEAEYAINFMKEHKMLNDLYPTKIGNKLYWGGEFVTQEDFLIDTLCDAPCRSASICYNGDVCLCCNFGAIAGNVSDRSFLELWQSHEYQELRNAVNDNPRMPRICMDCNWVNR